MSTVTVVLGGLGKKESNFLKCYFTSTETVGLLGMGVQDVHLSFFTQLLSTRHLLYSGLIFY